MESPQHAHKLKLFISYSRRESAHADALVAHLEESGFDVLIDRRDLPFGEKWQAELAEFIRQSDTVIWLISEASIRSKWVNWELDEVAKRNKRLVPIMIASADRNALPRQLGEIHILPVDRVFDVARDLAMLVDLLETDRAWLKQASRLQDRATEWLAKARAPALLLSRGTLADAERWKDARPTKAPTPAQEVLDLLLASRQAATRRQRWWTIGLGAIVLIVGAAGLWADVQRRRFENFFSLATSFNTFKVTDDTERTDTGEGWFDPFQLAHETLAASRKIASELPWLSSLNILWFDSNPDLSKDAKRKFREAMGGLGISIDETDDIDQAKRLLNRKYRVVIANMGQHGERYANQIINEIQRVGSRTPVVVYGNTVDTDITRDAICNGAVSRATELGPLFASVARAIASEMRFVPPKQECEDLASRLKGDYRPQSRAIQR